MLDFNLFNYVFEILWVVVDIIWGWEYQLWTVWLLNGTGLGLDFNRKEIGWWEGWGLLKSWAANRNSPKNMANP